MNLMQPTRYLRHWGVYLKLGIPKPGSGLPLLVYVGSATGVLGFIGRFMSHLSAMIRGHSDGFYTEWIKNPDQYEIVYFELWCIPDFGHRKASTWERVQASLLCLLAESVLMHLFGAHSVLHQASPAVAFLFSTVLAASSDDKPFITPTNRSDPLKTPPSKEHCKYCKKTNAKVDFACLLCGKMFRTARAFARHRAAPSCAAAAQPLPCSQCDLPYNFTDGCQCDLTCSGCQFKFATISDFRDHIRRRQVDNVCPPTAGLLVKNAIKGQSEHLHSAVACSPGTTMCATSTAISLHSTSTVAATRTRTTARFSNVATARGSSRVSYFCCSVHHRVS